jgi:methyltransferase (TIGR00027 family)
METQIEHVSDTALMVAACRAIETRRKDGLVRDPFAERLAGERGMAIAQSVPFLELMCFVVGARARSIDELLMETVRNEGVETVVNLGAGLDTRPWRLDLPHTLRWIEADFPEILEYKASRLASETPHPRLEQIAADFSSSESRAGLLERVGPGSAVMITEGLLMYLPHAAFMALAQEAPQLSGVRRWLLDAASTDSWRRMTGGGWNTAMERLRPADHLAGQALLDAAQQASWAIEATRLYRGEVIKMPQERISALVEALKRAGRTEQTRDNVSGVYLLQRAMA